METPEIVAGFAGSEATKTLKNSLVFGEERLGKGSVIYMVDNPLFRALKREAVFRQCGVLCK